MDDIAAAAGVGKGTVFRRFGSRAGLMIVLLDEDEKVSQQAFMFGPPPLGPDAPPLERLLAFGRERLRFAQKHQASAFGGQPRPADPLQRACDAAAHPRPAAARRPRAPPVTSTRRPTRCLRCSTPTTCTTNSPTAARRSSPSATRGRAWRASSAARDSLGPARRPRPVPGCGRSTAQSRTRRAADHRRRQRRPRPSRARS